MSLKTKILSCAVLALGLGRAQAALPDLQVTTLQITMQPVPGCVASGQQSSLGLLVQIQNNGAVQTYPTDLSLNGNIVGAVPGMAPSGSTSVYITSTTAAGSYTVMADASNTIAESDENNNTLIQYVPVPTPPPACAGTATPTDVVTVPANPNYTFTATPTPTATVPANPNYTLTATPVVTVPNPNFTFTPTMVVTVPNPNFTFTPTTVVTTPNNPNFTASPTTVVTAPGNPNLTPTVVVNGNAVKVYPNPAHKTANFAWNMPYAGNVVLTLRTPNGSLVAEKAALFAAGPAVLALNIASLPRGVYLYTLSLQTPNNVMQVYKTGRVVKR